MARPEIRNPRFLGLGHVPSPPSLSPDDLISRLLLGYIGGTRPEKYRVDIPNGYRIVVG